MSIPTLRKSGLMMKLLTPFIWFSFSLSLHVYIFRGRHRQSLKLQLTNYVIMISMMMNGIGLWRDIKENNRRLTSSLFFYSFVLKNFSCSATFLLLAPLTTCKTIIKLINVQTVIKAINHPIDREIYLF